MPFLFSSFSGKEEGQTEKEKQIDQIYFEYGKKLSPIAEVRYKALDIKDESLGSLFEKFHSEMHNIDTMILNALKASFEAGSLIKFCLQIKIHICRVPSMISN